jgi:hypothetical protein
VGLILPLRLELVLPEASFVSASPVLLAPDDMLLPDDILLPDDLLECVLSESDLLDCDFPDMDLPELESLPDAPLVVDFGVALVVAFSPVGLILPARLASVLPSALLLVASAPVLELEPDVWAWTDAVPIARRNAVTAREREVFRM